MSAYYRGKRARCYDQRWHQYTTRTLSETLALIDPEKIEHLAQEHHRIPRLLDVACGTGVLLALLHERIPEAQLSGVDGSQEMLTQARQRLSARSQLRLEHAIIGSGELAGLPFPPGSFDLITCTNALHDIADPVNTLASFQRLLTPGGWLVIEDYAQRSPAIPWRLVEWLARRIEGSQGRAYTLEEASTLCTNVALRVEQAQDFVIDVVFHGWVLRARKMPGIFSGQ